MGFLTHGPGTKGVVESHNSKLAAEVGLEDVSVVANAPWENPAAALDGHEIEAAWAFPQPESAQVGRCGADQDLLLLRIQGGCRAAEEITGSRFDLDKDGLVALSHDQVELAAGATPVAVARAIALGDEEQQGGPLGAAPEFVWFGASHKPDCSTSRSGADADPDSDAGLDMYDAPDEDGRFRIRAAAGTDRANAGVTRHVANAGTREGHR